MNTPISPEARESALNFQRKNYSHISKTGNEVLCQEIQSALDKQKAAHDKEIALLREQIRLADVAFQHLFDTNKKEIAKYEEAVKAANKYMEVNAPEGTRLFAETYGNLAEAIQNLNQKGE